MSVFLNVKIKEGTMISKFTVYFEEPFWTGILEKNDNFGYTIGKVVFGKEPTDAEIHEFSLTKYSDINMENSNDETAGPVIKKMNPKRIQRLVIKEQKKIGIGTKARETLKKVTEMKKAVKKKETKLKNDLIKDLKFRIRQDKKKKKLKGH